MLPPRSPEPESLREIFAGLGLVTSSRRMIPILQYAYKAAQVSDTTVLLQGETGTGKQVLAYAIHQLDKKRRSFPYSHASRAPVPATPAQQPSPESPASPKP